MERDAYKERNSSDNKRSSLATSSTKNLKDRGKFFGDITSDSTKNENYRIGKEIRRDINDRLNNERIKALAALQKFRKSDDFKKPFPINNKENSKGSINIPSEHSLPMKPDHRDYVPFRLPNNINISDLVTDETINIGSLSSCSTTASKNIKLSFQANEITARSTLNDVSVNDILASSFAPKARNLYENLLKSDTNLDPLVRRGTESSTSSSNFNCSRSLPRTADVSLSKNSCTEESFEGGFGTFCFDSAGATDLNEMENFVAAELMESKLINDEILWAQERAAIPTATLSEKAKAREQGNTGISCSGFESSPTLNSIIADDPNFSVGNFFNLRSEQNIRDIVKSKTPSRGRKPLPLVDEDDNTVITNASLAETPKVDNKTYTLEDVSTKLQMKTSLPKANSQVSSSSADNSYLLSISAIDRALCNLDIQSNSSGIGVSEKLLKQSQKPQSGRNPHCESNNSETNGYLPPSKEICKKNSVEELILENKENLDPKRSSLDMTLANTMSFSETLPDSNGMKNLQRSTPQKRSPLSPIDVCGPIIHLEEGSDGAVADNDEWPSTPITNKKRIRRTKSPKEKSPVLSNGSKNNSPTTLRPSGICTPKNPKNSEDAQPKSMSSTRIDGEVRNTSAVCDFGISPNTSNSHHCTSSMVVSTNTLCVPQQKYPQNASPTRSNEFSMSSPRAYNLPQTRSPTPTNSPNLDATANIKLVASPVGSESSSTCSYRTLQSCRSAASAGSGRSVSRFSSSSEFIHRDGKQIPLKVTNTELSWGSIKLRSESKKSMQIKNTINKRLVIRIDVSGPGYQIVNSQRSNTITMHSQECRTIIISFCPTVCGVAIGKLSFYAPTGAPTMGNSFLDVPLFGYGGNASIIAQNIFIGPVGSPFVTMGDVCELGQPLERTISFYNKGPLLGFAAISIDSIGLMVPRISDAFEIHPRKILIPPKHVVDIHVVFRPKREDIKKIVKKMGSVLTLANLRVICGDEANRLRMGRLLSQMSKEERCKLSSTALDMLWTSFPQEEEITDLVEIKEHPSVAIDLASYCRIHEILLTINHDNLDDTFENSSILLADVDETVLFRTICPATNSASLVNLGTIDEDHEADDYHGAKSTRQHSSWSVTPQSIDINLNKQLPVNLRVQNGFKCRRFFEIACNVKDMLNFTPNDGYVAPNGGETDIIIDLQENFKCPSESVYIMVYMENERIVVPVNVIK